MNQLQQLTAAIWHDITCQTCRQHKGYKRVKTASYRTQAIERRLKEARKILRRKKILKELNEWSFLLLGCLIMVALLFLAGK